MASNENQIEKLRNEAGLTVQQAAKAAEMTVGEWLMMEEHGRIPGASMFQRRMASALGCGVDKILPQKMIFSLPSRNSDAIITVDSRSKDNAASSDHVSI